MYLTFAPKKKNKKGGSFASINHQALPTFSYELHRGKFEYITWSLNTFCDRGRVVSATETIVMGVSGKWIRALVGSKKTQRSQSSDKDENVGAYELI